MASLKQFGLTAEPQIQQVHRNDYGNVVCPVDNCFLGDRDTITIPGNAVLQSDGRECDVDEDTSLTSLGWACDDHDVRMPMTVTGPDAHGLPDIWVGIPVEFAGDTNYWVPVLEDDLEATPRFDVRQATTTAETGTACPECKENIASTHGAVQLPTSQIADPALREAIDTETVAANGWRCEADGLVVPRDLEIRNSVWAQNTNGDDQYIGVVVEYDAPDAGEVLAAVHRDALPADVLDEWSDTCPCCGGEYGGCVSLSRQPCVDCRGERRLADEKQIRPRPGTGGDPA